VLLAHGAPENARILTNTKENSNVSNDRTVICASVERRTTGREVRVTAPASSENVLVEPFFPSRREAAPAARRPGRVERRPSGPFEGRVADGANS